MNSRALAGPLSVAALATALLVVAEREACACAPVGPRGVPIEVVEEEALVAWNAETKTEHFVRRAAFATKAKNFGFLVPTPSVPDLTEVDSVVFKALEASIVPAVVTEDGPMRPEFGCLAWSALGAKNRAASGPTAAAARATEVTVLSTAKVAGYEAATLEAADAGLLAKWLVDRGYDTRPSLRTWLEPYVAAKWKLTAFKYVGETEGSGAVVGTNAVRMSFSTDRPFYPYREPRDVREKPAPSRSLRVYVLSSEGRMDATLGDSAPFAGVLEMSQPVPLVASLASALPGRAPPSMWLSVWRDRSSPRVGTDEVFFKKAPVQTPVPVPPIVIKTPRSFLVPIDVIVGLGLVVFGLGAFFMRRGRAPNR